MLFFLGGTPFTGVAIQSFQSGKIKTKRSFFDGMLHGISRGYNEDNLDDFFQYSFVYNYKSGRKIGEQKEYYQYLVEIPNYDPKPSPNGTKFLIGDFDTSFFGNRDHQRFRLPERWFYKTGSGTASWWV
jgi:hypothetical protein